MFGGSGYTALRMCHSSLILLLTCEIAHSTSLAYNNTQQVYTEAALICTPHQLFWLGRQWERSWGLAREFQCGLPQQEHVPVSYPSAPVINTPINNNTRQHTLCRGTVILHNKCTSKSWGDKWSALQIMECDKFTDNTQVSCTNSERCTQLVT